MYLQEKVLKNILYFLDMCNGVQQCYVNLPCECIVDCNSYPIFCGEIEQGGDVHFKRDMATTVITSVLPIYIHSSCVVDRTKSIQKQVSNIELSRDVMSISKKIWPKYVIWLTLSN